MVSRLVSRVGRRLAGGLVLAAILLCFAVPAQAGVRGESVVTAPASVFIDWIQDLLAQLGLWAPESAAEPPEEPTAVFSKDGCGIDPNGTPCPESDDVVVVPAPEGMLVEGK